MRAGGSPSRSRASRGLGGPDSRDRSARGSRAPTLAGRRPRGCFPVNGRNHSLLRNGGCGSRCRSHKPGKSGPRYRSRRCTCLELRPSIARLPCSGHPWWWDWSSPSGFDSSFPSWFQRRGCWCGKCCCRPAYAWRCHESACSRSWNASCCCRPAHCWLAIVNGWC